VDQTGKLTTPVKEKLTGVKSVAAGGFHYLALKKDGTVWAKGWNKQGQLGVSGIENASNFLQVKNLKDVETIGAGYLNSYAVTKEGAFYAWGDNSEGQLGNNSLNNSTGPLRSIVLQVQSQLTEI
jgi:alpha-tubulin suppressor-like RCC1 family protein